MARAVRTALSSVAAAAVVVAATGWLYLARPALEGWPGPRVREALPLDELSRRAGLPLLAFLAVWVSAAALLALLAWAARAERLTAALLLALGVGGWGYVATGTAIVVVRQVPAHEAFATAATVRAVYIPAVLAGLAGAIGGRAATERRRAPVVLAWFVAATGALGVLDAMLPERPRALISQLAPLRVYPLTSSLVAPVGLALLFTARGLSRRKHRAWQLSMGLLAGLTALHLLHSFNYGAIATGLVAIALLARRTDFNLRGDPEARPRMLLRGAVLLAGIYAYAAAALWVNRVMVDEPYSISFAARETTAALLGLRLHGSGHLGADFATWFPFSVFLAGLAAAAWLLVGWLAPWRYRLRQGARERQLARDLVSVWGVDTLAPFVLRGDKSYFFTHDARAFVAYKVVGGVAIVSGDPIGPPATFDELVSGFIRFAHERDWRVAVLGASERCLALYRAHGLNALYHGDEAVVETARFSLEGRPIRKVRQSVHRLERAGFRAQVLRPGEIGHDLRRELENVARAWRGAAPARGFVMALDALFSLGDEDAVFVVGFGPDGHAAGFLHFAVCHAASALSLSSMPRLGDTPNGFTEWLVCEAVAWAHDHGFERVSLNFAPFAALLAPEAKLSALQRFERRALLSLKGRFQLDNLLAFNRKFFPTWEPRFVVYERRLDLPRVGVAALAAEAYLPFAGRARR
ncbi:MAG: phosphatidylglycerol lysyltransferase domain-containing protein [Gaiellaceae bacterium]